MIPQVTVLMSCFNASKWLSEAIDSVLYQTFSDFELLIIDDGSTDDTLKIIQEYGEKDDRIVSIHKGNTGLTDSLNTGILQARGEWIARLDSDDICEIARLADQVNYMRSNPDVVLLGTGFTELDEFLRPIRIHSYPTGHNILVRRLERLRGFFPHSSAIYTTSIVRRLGGYNLRYRRAQDRKLWLDLSRHGRIATLSEPLVGIRRHSNQISHVQGGRLSPCSAMAATVGHFLQLQGLEDPSVTERSSDWEEFILWVERRMDELKCFEMIQVWRDSREQFYSSDGRLKGLGAFATKMLISDLAFRILSEKLVGSSLPRQLAKEWEMRFAPG